MTTTARHYAEALYEATAGKSEREAAFVVRSLCDALAKEGRQDFLESIALEYRKALLKHNQLPELFVESAEPLSDALRRAVVQAFDADEETAVRVSVNPELIGGLTAQHNDIFTDISVRGKLAQLKKVLS